MTLLYQTHLLTFYEDDMMPFLPRSLNIWATHSYPDIRLDWLQVGSICTIIQKKRNFTEHVSSIVLYSFAIMKPASCRNLNKLFLDMGQNWRNFFLTIHVKCNRPADKRPHLADVALDLLCLGVSHRVVKSGQSWKQTSYVTAQSWTQTNYVTAQSWTQTSYVTAQSWTQSSYVTAQFWTQTSYVTAQSWTQTNYVTAQSWTQTSYVTAQSWTQTNYVTAQSWTQTNYVTAQSWTQTM
jgi:hypothetical protein